MKTTTLVGGQKVWNVHEKTRCRTQYCTIHNNSPHHMVTWTQVWDELWMWRICPAHGHWHPDPDDHGERPWHVMECLCRCCEWSPDKAAREIISCLVATPDDREGFTLLAPVLPSESADLSPVNPYDEGLAD